MFESAILEKLAYLDGNKICCDNNNLILTESNTSGKACLTLQHTNSVILAKKADKNQYPFLKNQRCADHFLFEYNETLNLWYLHIFEFTKTVRYDDWTDKIQVQFAGGILNARVMAAFLGIEIKSDNYRLYTGFRKDDVRESSNASPISKKVKSGQSAYTKAENRWENKKVCIDGVICLHTKIQLDMDSGEGTYCLTED